MEMNKTGVRLNESLFMHDPVLNRFKNKIMISRKCNRTRFFAIRSRILEILRERNISLDLMQKKALTQQIKDYLSTYGEVKE